MIKHFSVCWKTFTEGFAADVATLSTTVNDQESGLVRKVTDLQTSVHEIKEGKKGEQPLATHLTNFGSRLDALEKKKNVAAAPSEAVANRLNTLETKCLKENEGLPKELSEIKADIASLKAKIEQLAEFGEDGTPTLKTPDVTDLKRDTFYVHKDLQTMAGYLHVMERDVQNLNHRTDQNYAKLIKNTLIFGDVKSADGEPALDALKTFLRNIMKITPKDHDIITADKLGKSYTRKFCDGEITLPPQIKARCSEYFANKVMHNAAKLAGKQDQEQGFKYLLKGVSRNHTVLHVRSMQKKRKTCVLVIANKNRMQTRHPIALMVIALL